MKKLSAMLLSAVMTVSALTVNAAAEVKTTPSGLAYDEIGSAIEEFTENKKFASFGAAVFVGDEVLYSGHFGYADRENEVLADDTTVYEWGSISKMFTWVSVMQLYEDGLIDLNKDVTEYLPDGFMKPLAYDEPITMLHLMNHTAGFQETIYPIMVSDEADIIPLDEALKSTQPPQVSRPGEITAYSNWGAALAGYIVECVSGTDYAEYVRQNIIQPLGMEHTAVAADYRDNEYVRTHREQLKAYMIMEQMGTTIDMPLGTMMSYVLLYPAGSVTGTLEDITTFAQAFVDEDTPLFDKPETLDMLLTATSYYGDTDAPRNHHGLWAQLHAVDALGHGGNTNSCSAQLTVDPVSKTGVVVLTNQMGEGTFTGGIPSLILGEFADNVRIRDTEITERNDISGSYVNRRGYFKGFPKIMSSLNLLPAIPTSDPDVYDAMGGKITRVANDWYIIEQAGTKMTLFANDKGNLECYVMDYTNDSLFWVKFACAIAFAALAVVMFILLIVKLIIHLVKKRKPDAAGWAAITAQAAGAVSGLSAVALILLGIIPMTKVCCTIFCIIQMVCALAAVAAAVILVKSIFTDKDAKKFAKFRYAVWSVYGAFTAVFIIAFELFNFWSC